MSEEIKKGLLGIVVDETTISHVVPELSTLTYRGYTVQELCDKCDFEEVAYLVLHGELPNKKQLKKFIKDVVEGTIERQELIDETIKKYLKDDFNYERSDKILKIILSAAIFEMLYKHNNSTKLIISEYLKSAEFFLEEGKIKYLNAILDNLAKKLTK